MMLQTVSASLLLADSTPAAAGTADITSVLAPYMKVFFVAFFVSIIATPVMRRLALANGIVDWPDHKRKNHLLPVAYLGGLAIFLGWLAGVGSSYFFAPHNAHPDHGGYISFPLPIILGAGAIVLTGLIDDVYGISPRVKIGGQLFAAAALASEEVGTSLVSQALDIMSISLPWQLEYAIGTIVIAAFVIGACNAMNLIDGLDGLAAGTSAIACVGFLIMAAIIAARHTGTGTGEFEDPVRLAMCLAILGGILGFLPYNFNPATIFMGDAGSLLLGFLCVSTILLFTRGTENALLLVTAALIVFALPITDTSLAIVRRKLRGQPLFSPDNQHIHHLLRRTGLSVKKSVCVMYGVALVFAALGVTMVAMDWRWRYMLAVFVVIYGFIMVTAFKYGQHQLLLERLRQQEGEEAAAAAKRPPAEASEPGPGERKFVPGSTSEAAGADSSEAKPKTGRGEVADEPSA